MESSIWVFSISGKPPMPEPITHADARGQLFRQGFARGQASVFDGLFRCRDTVMDEGVHGARIFGAHVLLHVEAFDFTCNLAGESLDASNLVMQVNTGLTGQDIGPGALSTVLPTGLMQPRPVTTTRRRLMRSNLY